jgi:sulfur carrier protein
MTLIEISLNGRAHPLPPDSTIDALLAELDLTGKSLAISINRKVIKRADWPTKRIDAADRIEIVHAIGGG